MSFHIKETEVPEEDQVSQVPRSWCPHRGENGFLTLSPLRQSPEPPVCYLDTTILPTPEHISQQGKDKDVGGSRSGRGGTRGQKKECHSSPQMPLSSSEPQVVTARGHEGITCASLAEQGALSCLQKHLLSLKKMWRREEEEKDAQSR